MSARGRMTMRAEVERNTATGTDAHGGPVPPVYEAHTSLPCFVWSRGRREVVDGDKTAFVEDLRAMFPFGADLTEGDRIARVTDRAGGELWGRLDVGPIQRKFTHVECALERVE